MGSSCWRVSAKSYISRRLWWRTGDATGGFGVVVVKEEGFAIGGRSEEARIGMDQVAFIFLELHVRRDIAAERTDGMGEGGGAKSGGEFFGDGATADKFASLED